MKAIKIKNSVEKQSITEETSVPLVPQFLFYFLVIFLLSVPSLIFSGYGWFDTLHIMKWTCAMVPISVISIIGGLTLLVFGSVRTNFKIDLFGWMWLLMLGYISAQPIWVRVMSWSTYVKEWLFFASLFALYIFCYDLFKNKKYHKLVLWLANINATLNVVFAELLIRNMNGPFKFIMNVPGNYIGNTGQQEMFGLWMAMAVMNSIYLNTVYFSDKKSTKSDKWLKYSNILLLIINAWGMWNSTTRAGVLSLLTGTIIISLIFNSIRDKLRLKKVGQAVIIVVLVLGLNIAVGKLGLSRAYDLMNKTMDMFMNPGTFGKRDGIWKTSLSMIKEYPIKGVGIGHYKWHYLEAQSFALAKYPNLEWQFTYWAHSEYLQWFAEFGLFGALLLLVLGLWWLCSFIKALLAKKNLSLEATWAISMIFLIWFDALFSRPFHRIEIAVWLAFAFAIANREILPISFKWSEIRHSYVYRAFGLLIVVLSIAGLAFLGTGLIGDKYLRSATQTQNAELQRYRIDQALKMPMEKDEAQEQLAYHLIAVASATHKNIDWSKAINQLYFAFTIRPQAKQLNELLSLAQQTKNQALLSKLLVYISPAPNNGTSRSIPAKIKSADNEQ